MRTPQNGDFSMFLKSGSAAEGVGGGRPPCQSEKFAKTFQINPDVCCRGNLGWLVDILKLKILKIFLKIFKRSF